MAHRICLDRSTLRLAIWRRPTTGVTMNEIERYGFKWISIMHAEEQLRFEEQPKRVMINSRLSDSYRDNAGTC